MAGVENPADAGMVEPRRHLGFAPKTTEHRVGLERGPDDLERHNALEPRVSRLVHNALPAAAELVEQLVVCDAWPIRRALRLGLIGRERAVLSLDQVLVSGEPRLIRSEISHGAGLLIGVEAVQEGRSDRRVVSVRLGHVIDHICALLVVILQAP